MIKKNLEHHINIRVSGRIYEQCAKLAQTHSIPISAMARIILTAGLNGEPWFKTKASEVKESKKPKTVSPA